MNVLSLFDGISCGRLALERAGFKVDRYVAYEIDKHAVKISKKNFPDIEHYGDVFEGDFKQYENFDLLIGGSPCTFWSIANKNRETTSSGTGFELFMQYVRALEEAKPKYFLYENNHSISKEIKSEITKKLGVEPIMINSSLLSAQERKRCYWTNIPNIKQPDNKKIYLKDILEITTEEPPQDKILTTKLDFNVKVRKHYIDKKELSKYLKDKKKISGKSTRVIAEECNVPLSKAEHWFRTDNSFSIPDAEVWEVIKQSIAITDNHYDKAITEFETKQNTYDMAKRIYNVNGKHPTLTTLTGGNRKTLTDGTNMFCLTPIHCERLQTLPDNYTEGVSDRQRFKAIGNGWTVDIIAHILKNIGGIDKEG